MIYPVKCSGRDKGDFLGDDWLFFFYDDRSIENRVLELGFLERTRRNIPFTDKIMFRVLNIINLILDVSYVSRISRALYCVRFYFVVYC